MTSKKPFLFFFIVSLCALVTAIIIGGLIAFGNVSWLPRTQPQPSSQALFQGVKYNREIRGSPRLMVIHVVTVDLRSDGIRLLVTPGDAKADLPLKARTTSKFLDDFNLQIAINGGGFSPWHSNHFWDYYPHNNDPVEPLGYAASQGTIYSENNPDQPVLYISRTNQARFGSPQGKIFNAIAGNQMLLQNGQVQSALDDESEPRSAIGLDKRGKFLILVVVDGRQPGYSLGATLEELAEILLDYGAYTAMNLDGGGSSSLVMQNGIRARMLNSPVNHGIPGWERPVGNHLGIFAKPPD